MLTTNHETITKNELVTRLRKSKGSKYEVWDLNDKQDFKELSKSLEKQIRKGCLSVVVVKGAM